MPLYFSAPRPVVNRDGLLVMVDDERLPLKKAKPQKCARCASAALGCYPLTGAVESTAATLPEIIQKCCSPHQRAPEPRHRP